MASELQRIKDAAWRIVSHPKSNRIEILEALKLLASCKGLLIPDLDERWLTVRQVAQLRRIKQELVETVLRRKERKRKANRKAYIRRLIKAAESAQPSQVDDTAIQP
jgi:hypothetical protein